MGERKALAEEWIKQASVHGLYTIVNVGDDDLSVVQELAEHAKSIGADAIATVPAYYGGSSNVQVVVQWLAAISGFVDDSMPLFYYHIPGTTGVNIKITELLAAAETQVPMLAGVKYVSGDLYDFTASFEGFPNVKMMFAPEPKLAGIPLGGTSVVLAESFYASSWLRMYAAYKKGDMKTARAEQLWKRKVSAIFSKYGGGAAERYVWRHILNVDMGPPRLPELPLSESEYESMVKELDGAGFFSQTPAW